MITDTDKAWLAGVIDTCRWDPNVTGVMRLTLDSPQVADRVTLMTGGYKRYVPLQDKWRRACAEHCPEQHVHQMTQQDRHYVQIKGYRLEIVLRGLAAFSTYHRQFQATRRRAPNKSLVVQMSAIGWDVSWVPDKIHGFGNGRRRKDA